MLTESHYSNFIQANRDYLTAARQAQLAHLEATDKAAKKLEGKALTDYLTKQNYKLVADMRKQTEEQIASCITEGLTLSKLTFNMDINL